MICVEYPCRIVSEANRREHWGARSRRTRGQRRQARVWLRDCESSPKRDGHLIIRLTRIAPRKLDTDNLARAFKAVRDGVADWLGIDDGDERLTWDYAQEKGEPRQYAVRIEVWAKDEWNDEAEAWTA